MNTGAQILENARHARALVESYKKVPNFDRDYLAKLEAKRAAAEIEETRYMRMLRKYNNHHCVN
jgi:hypothetical protein